MFSHFLRKLGSFGRPAGSVRVGGRRWQLAPDAGGFVPDLDGWLAAGLAEVVKENPYRTVYRVTLPGGAVFVKRCRVKGFRAWWREVLRPPKARLEFDNALALLARGVPAARPVSWGHADSPWPGESVLVTEDFTGVPLTRVLEGPLTPTDRRELAAALGRFFANLHDSGVVHPDPHPGNVLAAPDGRLALLDVHSVRLGRPVGWPGSRANLVLLNRWFQLRASRADRLRFWRAYRAARRTVSPPPDAPPDLERRTAASNLRFWAGRVRRCLGTGRHFRRVKAGAVRGWAVRDLPGDFLREFLADPAAVFRRPGVRVLKDARTSTVAALDLPTPDGPRSVVLKRVNVRRWHEPVKNLFRPSAVVRSWVNGHTLRDRRLPTPRPLAAVQVYRHGLPAEGYLLTELVPGADDLTDAVPDLTAVADRLARLVRQMHDRRVSHRDLKAANVLLEWGTTPTLIDLVGVRVGRPVSFRQRARELARLNASFLRPPRVRHADRLRFLRAYLAAGERRPEGWKAWWRAVAGATAAKVARNRRSGRPLA
jgi:serine/threonine protein kinase